MHLIDLLQNLVEMPTPAKTMVISGLVADSRRVGHGNLFALNGTSDDGYNYSKHAINSGAVAILGDSRPFDNDIKKLAKASNVILLNYENPRWVMSQAAARYWPKRPNMVTAVTGTNGKTSTAEFLRQIWRRASWKTATLGTLGIIGSDSFSKKDSILDLPQLTTPDCLSLHSIINDLSKAGMTRLALEASSHGLEQYRLDGLEIHVAGFTNLSRDHLDHHLDMGAYFSSKLRLFTELLKPGGCAVINLDDPFSEKILEQIVTREIVVKTFGYSEKADFCIKSISPSGDGLDMVVNHQGKTWNIPLALSGPFKRLMRSVRR